MDRYLRKILCLLIGLIFTYGCSPKPEQPVVTKEEEKIEEFTFRQFADKMSFVLTGESAEIARNDGTSVNKPLLSLTTSSELIEISTGKEGKGQFDVSPETKKINKVVFTGNVKINYKELSTGKVNMKGTCKKLTYLETEKMIIMEDNPVLESGSNKFSGDIIYYSFVDNNLKIDGNVNVQILTK
ncbi:hypothetical protein M0P98_04080 [bacterium]|nr:hypothetical protein [bacterium]